MERPTKEQVDGMLGIDVYDVDGSAARAIAENLQAEVRALRASEKEAWDHVNYPTTSAYVHCYPHKTAWVRGQPGEGCAACKLEAVLKHVRVHVDEYPEHAALKEENAELRRQLVAARSAFQQCTHERVDPNRDPFGGMGT